MNIVKFLDFCHPADKSELIILIIVEKGDGKERRSDKKRKEEKKKKGNQIRLEGNSFSNLIKPSTLGKIQENTENTENINTEKKSQKKSALQGRGGSMEASKLGQKWSLFFLFFWCLPDVKLVRSKYYV